MCERTSSFLPADLCLRMGWSENWGDVCSCSLSCLALSSERKQNPCPSSLLLAPAVTAGAWPPGKVNPLLWSGCYQLTSLKCTKVATPLHRKTQVLHLKPVPNTSRLNLCGHTAAPLATIHSRASWPSPLNMGQGPHWQLGFFSLQGEDMSK